MKTALNTVVSAVPIVQVLALIFLCFYDVSNECLMWLSAQVGSSSLTLLVFVWLYFFSRYKYCDITKFCVIALIANHVLFIVGDYINYDTYGYLYTLTFSISAIVLGLFTDFIKK